MAKGKKRGKKSGLANPAALDGSQDTPPPTAGAPIPVEVKAPDKLRMLNMRFRESTMDSLWDVAEARGMTMKQVVTHALREVGVQVAEKDLQDGSPKRRFVYRTGVTPDAATKDQPRKDPPSPARPR